MRLIFLKIIVLVLLPTHSYGFVDWNKKDHLWAGVGIGFPTRYDENTNISPDSNLKGFSNKFPIISAHYFFQYAPIQITKHAFFGFEFGGGLTTLKRKDDRNEEIKNLYLGGFIDIEKLLEINAGLHSSDFELRSPGSDRGLYLGAAYNFWRGKGFRMQLGYKVFQATKTDVEGEYANFMINLIVSYNNFIN